MSPSSSTAITSTTLGTHLPLLATGKVREIYTLTPTTLLFVATDRISAYDVILSTGIPSKGALLTRISAFWFAHLSSKLPHLHTHFLSLGLPDDVAARVGKETVERESLQERCCVVKKLRVLPVESIVRGYITGSAWESYKKTGKVNGEVLPEGLKESQKLERPVWTPSTKAEQGAHDENISREEAAKLLGADVARALEKLSLEIYEAASEHATAHGIILADTKFEFAVEDTESSSTQTPQLILVDEVLTPDSSRFWRASDYAVGRGQKSLDKQYLRDWLTQSGLKGVDGVEVPDEVVAGTQTAYREAFEMLTGEV